MRKFLTLIMAMPVFLFSFSCSSGDEDSIEEPVAENLYFPPGNSGTWENVSISALGWNSNALQPLLDYLEQKDSKAFIILKNGRIAVEAYFNGGSATNSYPWFSAGKTLTAFTTGIAQQEGLLNLDDPSSNYLGTGWSSLNPTDEEQIKVRHHITMTTGIDFNVPDLNCTDAACLDYLNPAGTYWYYHNATYTLAQKIVEGSSGQMFSSYFNTKVRNMIGMDGSWIGLNYNNIYFSTARSMARFGLLNLNKGKWINTVILADQQYFTEMTSTSQNLNKSYGYLWWLNGQESYRIPGSTTLFEGKLVPAAPDDLISGLGANDQKLYVVPSKGLVIVRLGADAGEAQLGPSGFDTLLWEKINDLIN